MTARQVLQPFAFGLYVLGMCYFMGTRVAAIAMAITMVLWTLIQMFINWRDKRATQGH